MTGGSREASSRTEKVVSRIADSIEQVICLLRSSHLFRPRPDRFPAPAMMIIIISRYLWVRESRVSFPPMFSSAGERLLLEEERAEAFGRLGSSRDIGGNFPTAPPGPFVGGGSGSHANGWRGWPGGGLDY